VRGKDLLRRIGRELTQAWAILVQDARTYYLSTPMIMWGLLMPFFLFLPSLMQEEMTLQKAMPSLLAMITFLSASSTGPVILPLERRAGTYDRLLAAPVSLITVLLGKSLVGVFFCLAVSAISVAVGLIFFDVHIARPGLLVAGVFMSSLAFSALGILFVSGSAQSPGRVMMPTMLLRWPLLFISGVFIPRDRMAPWLRALSYLSPLTYAQDVLTHAVLGSVRQVTEIIKPCGRVIEDYLLVMAGVHNPLLDLAILLCLMVLFFLPALKLHHRSRRLGY
jgi:ABC-2 type transport system permease protein